MPWVIGTRDKCLGFNSKKRISFSKEFYKNVEPYGMDRFKLLLVKENQIHSCVLKNGEKPISNNGEKLPKNSVNIRSKIFNKSVNRINKTHEKSLYEINTLLNTVGRES